MTAEHYPVELPATYKRQWDDGFGARGWKLDATMDDPMVIASTAVTGDRIPTSVFVHDILDHHLGGLPLSGHRNEAIALTLLADRTGTSAEPDFIQMVEEDILRGKVHGETMQTFLAKELVEQVPVQYRRDDKLLIGNLLGILGEPRLRRLLVDNFYRLGKLHLEDAKRQWTRSALDFNRRSRIGLAIQSILQKLDNILSSIDPDDLHGIFYLSSQRCAFISDKKDINIEAIV